MDVSYIIYLSISISFVIMNLVYFLIPESPKYLHAMGRYEDSRQVLNLIANVNGSASEVRNFDQIRFAGEDDH